MFSRTWTHYWEYSQTLLRFMSQSFSYINQAIVHTVRPNDWYYSHTLSVYWNSWEEYREWVASHFIMSSSMKEWTSDEIKKLIGVYGTHPTLYDVSCSEYRNKELKNEIIKQFSETFQCTSQETGRKLHNFWFFFSQFFQYFVHHTKCRTLLLVHVHQINIENPRQNKFFDTALRELFN